MAVLTYDEIQIKGDFTVNSLESLEIEMKPNHHGIMKLSGIIDNSVKFTELENNIENAEIRLEERTEQIPIFAGVVSAAKIKEKNEFYYMEFAVVTGTSKLDIEKKSRSFQDVNMTYADVVRTVLKDTAGAKAIFAVGTDTPIGKPLIQYEETDWEFFKRLASHFDSVLIPDSRSIAAHFWFGMRSEGDDRTFPQDEYEILINEKYYKKGGKSLGLKKIDYLCYFLRGGNYRIGDTTTFRRKSYVICEQYARISQSELVFNSIVGTKKLVGEAKYFNSNFTGLSLAGEVVKTDHELINVHLDIDGDKQGPTYPFQWMPTTGNLMYCMPKIGTRVYLYLPDRDEQKAFVTSCIRTNGQNCSDIENYQNRFFTTEHRKRFYFFPDSIGLIADSEDRKSSKIVLDDHKQLKIESNKKLVMIAKSAVTLQAPKVTLRVPSEIQTNQTSGEIESVESKIVPKGTGH